MQKIRFAAIIAAVIVIFGSSARAQFVNGVEQFNGTSFDANTWVRYSFGQGTATVANGFLDLTGQNYLATKFLTVGVGDTISARTMLASSTPNGTLAFLGLTETPAIPFSGQNVRLTLLHTIQGESDFTFFKGVNGSASGSPHVMGNNAGVWFRIQLSRTSMSDYTCELFTDTGALVMRFNESYSGLPSRAAVVIGLGPTARFDWVAAPEPGALSLLSLGGLLALRRPR